MMKNFIFRKMKWNIIILVLIFIVSCQNVDEPKVEKEKEINIENKKEEIKKDEFTTKDSLFLEMIHEEVVVHENEKKYISNINELQSVELVECNSMNIHYKDVIDSMSIEFRLKLRMFKKEDHTIQYNKKKKDEK